MMLAAAIVAAFGLAGCNSNRAPDNGSTDSHRTETRATGGNTKTTGRVCQLLQDDNPNRGGRKVITAATAVPCRLPMKPNAC